MKKIFSVFRLDLKSLTKNLIVFVVVIEVTEISILDFFKNIKDAATSRASYYDDEDDEYEHEPETSRVRYESESYDARRASSLNMMDLNDL